MFLSGVFTDWGSNHSLFRLQLSENNLHKPCFRHPPPPQQPQRLNEMCAQCRVNGCLSGAERRSHH